MITNTEECEMQKSFSTLVLDSTQEYIGVMKLLQKFKSTESLQQASVKNDADILKTLENLVTLNNSYLTQGLEILESTNRFKIENSQFRNLNQALQTRCEKLDNYCEKLKLAKSYRVSRVFVDAIKKPGINTLMVPYKMFKILLSKDG